MTEPNTDTHSKALKINLDTSVYGTFAEIGAGQEIARWFFRVGGAAGTVAKSMSAYDMAFSDAIYGKSSRFVSCDRLRQMLDHEYTLLIERLSSTRGNNTTFFAFADTVSARNFKGTNVCHGWVGLRFQSAPGREPSEIVMHVNMLDTSNLQQQEALGILGVNLLYAAFFKRDSLIGFIKSFLDDLSIERIEIDLLEFRGADFRQIDNRLVGIILLQLGLSNAIVYDPDGNLLQPSEVMYKQPVMVERGAFRAVNQLAADHVTAAYSDFGRHLGTEGKEPLSILELSVNEVLGREAPTDESLIHRIDTLWELGHRVMVSRFREFFELTSYLRRYTSEPMSFLMGVSTVAHLFDAQYYEGLQGKFLEGISRLFSRDVSLYVYPMTRGDIEKHLRAENSNLIPAGDASKPVSVDDLKLTGTAVHLYRYLRESNFIRPVKV